MGKYSIKELEQLSGIKAHTIRIWEKRYRLIQPRRTKTNIRFYSDEDLKKIINVAVLNTHGIKISKIVRLSSDEINRKVLELSETKESVDIYIEQLIVTMIDLEEERFATLLLALTTKFGFEKTILEIVYPFLGKIGVLWQTDNITPAQEHFVASLIRQKMMVAIDALPLAPKTSPKAILFLPENELHEISLLFYYYLAKKARFRTYYLGQTVPYLSLRAVCKQHAPKLLITCLTVTTAKDEMEHYLKQLCADFPKISILASGPVLLQSKMKRPSNLRMFHNALEFKQLIDHSSLKSK